MKADMRPWVTPAGGIPTCGTEDLARGCAPKGDRRAKDTIHWLRCAWAAGAMLLLLGLSPWGQGAVSDRVRIIGSGRLSASGRGIPTRMRACRAGGCEDSHRLGGGDELGRIWHDPSHHRRRADLGSVRGRPRRLATET